MLQTIVRSSYSMSKKGPVYDPGCCRCCGEIKKCRVLNVEYEYLGTKEVYSEMFVDSFGLLLSNLDGEPTERLICGMCVSRLREACYFRQQVLQCENRLLTIQLNDSQEMKTEIEIKDEAVTSSDIAENGIDDIESNDNHEDQPKISIKKKRHKLEEAHIKLKIHKTKKKLDNVNYSGPLPKKTKPNLEDANPIDKISTLVENSYVCPFDSSFSDYFCVYCREVFTNPNKLREHTVSHDPKAFKSILLEYPPNKQIQIDVDRIDCRMCPDVITDIDSFQRHITSHGLEVDKLDGFLKFKLRMGSHHCFECGKAFGFFHALKKHMAEHFGTCICDVCGAHYFEERMLLLHRKSHDRKVEIDYNCNECGKSFKSKHARSVHVSQSHKKEAVYPCSSCDQSFFSYHTRYRHLIDVHGVERLFKCDQCDRTYDSRKSLREHNRRTHLNILKHACMLCDKRFYLPSRLKEHMDIHNGDRNFRCEYCGKSFPRLRTLRVHMHSHSTDKKFKCNLCNAAFTQNFNLKTHLKRQHGGIVDNELLTDVS